MRLVKPLDSSILPPDVLPRLGAGNIFPFFQMMSRAELVRGIPLGEDTTLQSGVARSPVSEQISCSTIPAGLENDLVEAGSCFVNAVQRGTASRAP